MTNQMTNLTTSYSMAEGSEVISEAEEINRVKHLKEIGDEAFRSENYAEALRTFGEALEIDENNIEIISAHAATCIQLENYVAAQKDAEQLLNIKPEYAQGNYLLGVALDNLGQYHDALLAFLRALELDPQNADMLTTNIASLASYFCKMPDQFLKSIPDMDPYKKLCEVGVCLFQSKKYDLCIKVLQSGTQFETNQKGITMKLHLTLANAHAAMKNRDLAISVYEECLSIAIATHDAQYQTKALVNIASLFLEGGDTHRAIIYYEKLLDLGCDLKVDKTEVPSYWNIDLQCALHLNLSIAYKSIGNIHQAVKHADIYVSLVKHSKNSTEVEGQSHHNVGMLYDMLGDYTTAVEHYKKYLDHAKKKGDKKGVAMAYGCIGSGYGSLKNKQLSMTYHQQHVNMAKNLAESEPRLLPVAYEQMGDTLSRMKNHEEAVESYTNMFQNCPRNDLKMKTTALCKLGSSFKEQEKYQYGLYYFEQAKVLAEDFNYDDILVMCKYNLASLMQHSTQMYELDHARKYLEQLIPMLEAKIQQHKDEGTFCPAELMEQLNECYRGIQNVLSKLGNKDECLQYAEAHKKKYITSIHNNSVKSPQHVNLASLTGTAFNTWNMDKIKRVMSQQNSTVLMFTIIPKHFFVWVLQPVKGLVRFYSGRAPKDSTVSQEINKCLMEIKKNKPLRTLPYACENRALPLDGTSLENLKKKNEALGKTMELNECSVSESKTQKTPQRRLFDMLVAPVEDILAKLEPESHLIVMPDGPLYEVPFGIIQDWSGKPLSSKFKITCMTSIYMMEKAVHNELNQLKIQDDLEFERNKSKRGGIYKIIQIDPFKSTSFLGRLSRPNSLDFHSLNPKKTSNPRLLKSGALQQSQEQSPSPRPTLIRENTCLSLLSRTSSPTKITGKASHISMRSPSPLGSPTEVDKVAGSHVLSTLVTKTSTGTDITTAGHITTEFQQVSSKERCVVIGGPSLPKKLMLHGSEWLPHGDLNLAEEECFKVAGYLDVIPVIGEQATKERFLTEMKSATIFHIATIGCLKEGQLVLAPNPNRQEEGPAKEQSYLVTLEDIVNSQLKAKLVILSSGWSTFDRNYIDEGYRLPGAFIAAGAQCVLTLLWPIPNVVLDKFFYHFYSTLHKGALVVDAVNQASQAVKMDPRFSELTLWSPFIVIGKDVSIDLCSVRQAQLDQTIDKTEQTYTQEKNYNPLNAVINSPDVASFEDNIGSLQTYIRCLLGDNNKQPDVIYNLIDLIDGALKRLHVTDINKQTVQLPECVMASEGGMRLLKLLGFHFQAKEAMMSHPYTVFPHKNHDDMIVPAYEALHALQDMMVEPSVASAIHEVLPMEQDKISTLIDMLCITKNAASVQLKTSDLSVKSLWYHKKIQALLTSIGYHQIGLLLSFNNVSANRKLLTACLQLFLSLSVNKDPLMLHKLDVSFLGPVNTSEVSSSIGDIHLPSLTPLLLPRNQVRMSTPWLTTAEVDSEMTEKIRLAQGKSDLTSELRRQHSRAKTWHELSVIPQASETLDNVGRPKTTPTKVKVMAGSSASKGRVPADSKATLSIREVDQRRDYANYILQQRLDGILNKHKQDVRKLYLPYIEKA